MREGLRLPGYPDIGLSDTVKDPFIDMLGAFNFALISFFRPRREKAGHIAGSLISRFAGKERYAFHAP